MAARILVVEDEAVVAMDLEAAIRGMGYEVTHVFSGEEALEEAAKAAPDVVLMDITLSGELDGIETADRLRSQYLVPIVFLTGDPDPKTLERAKKTEPMAYLLKPFRERELHSAIEIALYRRETERKLRQSKDFYKVILEALEEAILIVDANHCITFMNEAARQLTPERRDYTGEVLAEVLTDLGERTCELLKEAVGEVIISKKPCALAEEVRLDGPDGRGYQLTAILPVDNGEEGLFQGAVLLFRPTATKVSSVEERPRSDANASGPGAIHSDGRVYPDFDEITGLPGRGPARAAMADVISAGRSTFAVIYVLERFPLIKSRFGIRAANELIQYYAVHLAQRLAPRDQLYKWSEPAFVVLIDPLSNHPMHDQEVRRLAGRIRSVRLERILNVHSRSALVVISAQSRVIPLRPDVTLEESCKAIDEFVREQLVAYSAVLNFGESSLFTY